MSQITQTFEDWAKNAFSSSEDMDDAAKSRQEAFLYAQFSRPKANIKTADTRNHRVSPLRPDDGMGSHGGSECSSFLPLLFLVLLLPFFIPASRNSGIISLALLTGGGGIAALYPARTVARLLSSGEPMLVITQQGLRVGKLYSSGEIVLPWEEIAALYLVRGGIEKQLCIRPTDIASFLSSARLCASFSASI